MFDISTFKNAWQKRAEIHKVPQRRSTNGQGSDGKSVWKLYKSKVTVIKNRTGEKGRTAI